jgi:hypothetical protein
VGTDSGARTVRDYKAASYLKGWVSLNTVVSVPLIRILKGNKHGCAK